MQHDAQGLIITTGSDTSATAFDHVVEGYLKYRADLPQRVKILLETDPEFGLAHCVQGYLSMLAYKESVVPYAIKSERLAREHTARATRRERAHVDALAAWIAGNLDGAIAIWEGILRDHPRDVIAFRLAHFSNFWLGRPADMAASVERILPAWSEADGVTFASILACRCFALEEAGNLLARQRTPMSISTYRTQPRCCSDWSASAWLSGIAGWNSRIRRRRESAIVCRPSRCPTG